MSRLFAFLAGLALSVAAMCVAAQDYSGLARVLPDDSTLSDHRGGIKIDLSLSQGVPYRLFTLEAPDRLVLDFKEVDWTGLNALAFDRADGASAVRFGGFRPGWSRMVVDLAAPMIVDVTDMSVNETTGQARLQVLLSPATRAQFAALSVVPADPDWGVPPDPEPAKPSQDRIVVVIDPGHGGIDPGAERGGEVEKDLMLSFALEIREALLRVDGMDVVLTRDEDVFVSLERRVAIAHQAGAHVFISLHADALAEGHARGATVHTLSEKASDAASALLAERHNRADMLAGVDLTGSDDVIADVLMDLARTETRPRTRQLAKALIDALRQAGAPLNRRAHRSAAFSVLKAPDIPSVLLEIGFLSSDRDRKNIANPGWRRQMAEALRDGLQAWIISDAALRELVRQ
ncbi:N-acetylmuramoyl-L-alanine amidase [Marimonas lutisalis]|uniref:N-acetylmuramoyl-L-alanine amidase n=1 Tax=Marimonas lutisalis TaxID=2545756 RepID=UPI0010F65D7F|nr:N-acetylmuramoyl-L-alanine amidase [Marimonas lutisalis]